MNNNYNNGVQELDHPDSNTYHGQGGIHRIKGVVKQSRNDFNNGVNKLNYGASKPAHF